MQLKVPLSSEYLWLRITLGEFGEVNLSMLRQPSGYILPSFLVLSLSVDPKIPSPRFHFWPCRLRPFVLVSLSFLCSVWTILYDDKVLVSTKGAKHGFSLLWTYLLIELSWRKRNLREGWWAPLAHKQGVIKIAGRCKIHCSLKGVKIP